MEKLSKRFLAEVHKQDGLLSVEFLQALAAFAMEIEDMEDKMKWVCKPNLDVFYDKLRKADLWDEYEKRLNET
jgi:hypothetical protein